MSQGKLGDALGLTFQQVQKYEKGTNRTGAGRLQEISHILQVPIAFFYEGAIAGSALAKSESKHAFPGTAGRFRIQFRGTEAGSIIHAD